MSKKRHKKDETAPLTGDARRRSFSDPDNIIDEFDGDLNDDDDEEEEEEEDYDPDLEEW
jgi:hypothetical protein